ncbi:glycerate kinase type-2 family protein [Thiohalobacter thiocyanaticus]|uniref:DUF4147 domain-containing protein n=1 Tax=Thiohalobacter thiocyanaticus TaxID=585455 RepID=A0A426QGF9_9GAMM|nr:DUF4147 domain-containing protein [Thiohalobacter thiocyanaticus]RRQ20837.1 DUF4147 domain-containing protein [Thiohalobacter thiocyanaticus]
MNLNNKTSRNLILEWYRAGLERVRGEAVTRRWLAALPGQTPVRLVAIGKAAEGMLDGAVNALGTRLAAGLSITKQGYSRSEHCADPRIECREAGHPLPDAASLAAGERLLAFIGEAPAGQEWVFLISGGSSSLVEAPVAGVNLDDLVALNDWLLGSGLDIVAMNRVRASVSRIKGGRLADYLRGRRVRCGLISDVPGDDPASIGSGLLVSPPVAGLDDIALPEALRVRLPVAVPARPDPKDFERIDCHVLARLDDALQAVAGAVAARGLPVHLHPEHLAGDAADAGRRLARELLTGAPGVHVWGGETTVRLPESPGQGGRNQHLALAAAIELAGRHDCRLLAAGTDGSDGPTDAAGALVDGGTLERGGVEGLSAAAALTAADAGTFLEASGDLIVTGPTGTNVMDLVIGWKADAPD